MRSGEVWPVPGRRGQGHGLRSDVDAGRRPIIHSTTWPESLPETTPLFSSAVPLPGGRAQDLPNGGQAPFGAR